jgi:hypothetical protein
MQKKGRQTLRDFAWLKFTPIGWRVNGLGAWTTK